LIVRVARYRVKSGREKEWEHLMVERGIPMLKAQRGIMVVYIGRAMEPERNHQYGLAQPRGRDQLRGQRLGPGRRDAR
jgi:hypothetical protein